MTGRRHPEVGPRASREKKEDRRSEARGKSKEVRRRKAPEKKKTAGAGPQASKEGHRTQARGKEAARKTSGEAAKEKEAAKQAVSPPADDDTRDAQTKMTHRGSRAPNERQQNQTTAHEATE